MPPSRQAVRFRATSITVSCEDTRRHGGRRESTGPSQVIRRPSPRTAARGSFRLGARSGIEQGTEYSFGTHPPAAVRAVDRARSMVFGPLQRLAKNDRRADGEVQLILAPGREEQHS